MAGAAGHDRPKGPIHNVPQGIQLSWTVRLLPYLDEAGTLKQIDLAAGAYAEKNAAVRSLRIAAFVCPSQLPGLYNATPASNYAGCHHDVEAPIAEDNHGVLFLNSHISARDVTDGVQHTIYVGEKRTSDDDLAGCPARGPPCGTRARRWTRRTMEKPASDLFVGGFGAYHPAGGEFFFSVTSPCALSVRQSTWTSTSNWPIAPMASS